MQRYGERQTKGERKREIYDEELAHVLIETEKSHDLPSARCRRRKASGVTPVQVLKPENQGS